MREWWILYVDVVSCDEGARVVLVLQSPTRECLEQAVQLGFHASNKEVEYGALLVGVSLALLV
ncbi:hypothetical protein AAG906_017907 [Vitis piasezkii]